MSSNGFVKRKVEGGTLLYIVFLCLMIFFLLLAFILKNQLDRDFISIKSNEFFFYENLNSSLLAYINNPGIKQFDPSGIPGDEIEFSTEKWGSYKIVNAYLSKNPEHYRKTVLIGQKPWGDEKISLYLCESNKKTYISGKCRITGTAYIPELGIKTCYVGGNGFRGNEYISGETKTSQKKLPLISQIDIPTPLPSDSIMFYEEISEKDSVINPFNKKTLFISSEGDITLNYKYILGKIIIASDRSVTIRPSSYIEDAIVIAPYIRVCSGFTGAVQCFASDSILIEKDCRIKYPSALILNNTTDTIRHKIEIEEHCTIHSDIVSYGQNSKIIIRKDSDLTGRLYSPGQVELESQLTGSCFCGELYRKVDGMVYTNTIYNNEIRPDLMRPEWAGSLLFETQEMQIKCLN